MRAVRSTPGQGGARRRAALAALLLASGALAGPMARRDLDVGVPPGPPTEWGRAFPAITPSRGPLFPTTPSPEVPEDPNRTRSKPARPELEAGVASSLGIVRILTWDLAAHMSWINTPPRDGPMTGIGTDAPPLPVAGEPLYWITLAPLLRLLLHPAQVSQAGTVAHLVELGEPSLGVLAQARQEKGLRPVCDAIEERVRPRRDGAIVFAPGETLRESMLARFVGQELVRVYPYDPEAAFGARVFLLGEELEPLVDGYTGAASSLLRRNATTALSRYSSPRAAARLVGLAAETQDAVVLARACAALGPQGRSVDAAPLLERLKGTRDRVERVILIGALGRLGYAPAARELVRLGKDAKQDKEEDVDVLLAALEALARIRAPEARSSVSGFLEAVLRSTRSSPKAYAAESLNPSVGPDVPDPADTRGRLVGQLALLAFLRVESADEKTLRRFLELFPDGRGRDEPKFRRGLFDNAAFGEVQPRAMPLALDTLPSCGEDGLRILEAIARDRRVEPGLRARALALLPTLDRRALALGLVDDPREANEVRIAALQVMTADRHPELVEEARRVLGLAAATEPTDLTAEERFLFLVAVRALESAGALEAADLVPLLAHAQDVEDAHGDDPTRVRAMVRELVQLAAERAQKLDVRRQIDLILEFVIDRQLNPLITADTRGGYALDMLGMLDRVDSHPRDEPYKAAVAVSIAELLLGAAAARQPLRERAEFAPPVPLETEVILALGRTGEAAAVGSLRGLLANRRNAHRATVLLALGMAGQDAAARDLCPFLLDEDAFVRFCAYESLRHLTGEDHFVDWMYGDLAARSAAAERYFQWTLRNRR